MNAPPLACPFCKALLRQEADRHLCSDCGRVYSHTMGIPDLRGPEVNAPPTETALVKHLSEIYPIATYEELALARVATRPTTEDRRQHFARYNLTMRERGRRFYRMFQSKLSQHWSSPYPGLALDLGCGIGRLLLNAYLFLAMLLIMSWQLTSWSTSLHRRQCWLKYTACWPWTASFAATLAIDSIRSFQSLT
jgi:uncharacterized protein YbaR (Trm112 family)